MALRIALRNPANGCRLACGLSRRARFRAATSSWRPGGTGLGGDDTAPSDDEELLGVTQHFSARLNLRGAGRWPQGMGRFKQLNIGFFGQRFGGDFNLYGPGSAGLELAEGLMHGGGHV